MNIHTQQLRYFIELADCLNFTKAAAKLYVAQPTLSQQISELEAQMGVALFQRNSRSVSLTPAGQLLKRTAPNILAALESVNQQMRITAAGLKGSLRIGFLESFQDMLPSIIQHFSGQYPDIQITPVFGSVNKLRQSLRNSSIDVALTLVTNYLPTDKDPPAGKVLCRETMCLAVPSSDPFVLDGCRDMTGLNGRDFVTFSEDQFAGNPQFCAGLLQQLGLQGNTVTYTDSLRSIQAVLESGLGFTFLPGSLRRFFPDSVTFSPIPDEITEYGVLWYPEHPNPVIPLFLESLETFWEDKKAS